MVVVGMTEDFDGWESILPKKEKRPYKERVPLTMAERYIATKCGLFTPFKESIIDPEMMKSKVSSKYWSSEEEFEKEWKLAKERLKRYVEKGYIAKPSNKTDGFRNELLHLERAPKVTEIRRRIKGISARKGFAEAKEMDEFLRESHSLKDILKKIAEIDEKGERPLRDSWHFSHFAEYLEACHDVDGKSDEAILRLLVIDSI